MNTNQIQKLIEDHYGLEVSSISSLEGYDSTNFKVVCNSKTFVLKQHQNTKETKELLLAENQIFEQLKPVTNFEFPQTISTNDNLLLIVTKTSIFRLLTYVEGEFLGNVNHTPILLRSLGKFLAITDLQIHKKFENAIIAKHTQWDVQHFYANYKYIDYIENTFDRSIVDYFFLQYQDHVIPIARELRKGIIHNDANDWNVLAKNGEISGIIDFGDMCHTWLINEIAVAITYVMMNKKQPLDAASEVINGYSEILPLQKQELEILYYLVAARLCTSVCNSAYSKTKKPNSNYITISEKPAWDLLRKWISINPIKAKDTFRKAAGYEPVKKKNIKDQLNKRKASISDALSLSYIEPIQMSQAAFQYMYDIEGNTFLDAYNNIMLVGHCHPKVVRKAQKKMAKLNTNTRYLYDELTNYSEKLLSKFPDKLNKVFFVNSGSAASDLAIRIAKTHTKKQKVLVLEHGYHGNTSSGIEISHYKYKGNKIKTDQNYVLAGPMPKVFGSQLKNDGEAGTYYAEKTNQIIDSNKNEIAAFIAEPIVGCGGQVPLAKGYLNKIYNYIRAQGGVCISDEVQVGFGRIGDYFWGYEMYDVVPDMVVIGKPMGNGHPIGAVVCTTELAESFDNGMEFFSSFGGNPVSCTIGLSVLEVIEEQDLQKHAKNVGDYLNDALKKLQSDFCELADIRGSGMFIGVEILDLQGEPNTKLAQKIKNELRNKFILIGTDGPYDNVLKIKPPLYFNTDNALFLINSIRDILLESTKI